MLVQFQKAEELEKETASEGRRPGSAGEVPRTESVTAATFGYLAVVVFAWGGNYTWTKLVLDDCGPWLFNALRYGSATAILGVLIFFRRTGAPILPVPGERFAMAAIGVLQIAIMTGASTLALTMIEASRTVLIAYSMPIWGMLLSFVVLGERVTAPMLAGIILGFAGLAILCAPWVMDWTSGSALLGSGLALGGTLAWALASVLYRTHRWRSDFWSQIFGQLVAAMVLLAPAAFFLERQPITYTTTFGAVLFWNAVVPTIIAFYCWARALDRLAVARASQVLLMSPVFGVLLSAVVLDEALTPALIVSGALILLGAVLSNMPRSVAAQPARV
ncbi:MAG: putative transport protein [Rhodospirillales bacterium]|nr:putative transport protein [Rhodospirillales bacterium]